MSDSETLTRVDDDVPSAASRSRALQLGEVVFLYVACVSAALVVSALLVAGSVIAAAQ